MFRVNGWFYAEWPQLKKSRSKSTIGYYVLTVHDDYVDRNVTVVGSLSANMYTYLMTDYDNVRQRVQIT